MKNFYIVSAILNESELSNASNLSPEEKAKRMRMIKRMAALGMAAGAGVTAGELMLHKGSRAELINAMRQKGVGTKLAGVGKQVWKPMALGMGADLVIEPTNVKIAQAMEDRLQKKKELEKQKLQNKV